MSDQQKPIDDLLGEKVTPVNGTDDIEPIDLDEERFTPPSDAEALQVRVQQNVEIELPWQIEKPCDPRKPFMDLPSDTSDATIDAIAKAPNISHISSEPDRKWAGVLNSATNLNMTDEPLLSALSRPGSKYKQYVDLNGKKLVTTITPLHAPVDKILSGQSANIRADYHAGLGGICTTPLWHSGFWISFNRPLESDFVDLNRMLLQDKVTLGRQTVGAVYSNMTSFMVDRVIDFAIDHIYSMSMELEPGMTRSDIKKHILPQDIGYIVVGLMAARYTNGYQYRRPCTHSPEKCHHVVEEIIDLTKISHIDNNALTEWQKTHMGQRKSSSVKIADVNRYKQEMVALRDKVVKVGFLESDTTVASVTLAVPSITEYVEAGYRWIDNIVETVGKGLTENSSNRDKERFINQHARATKLRTYSHWVKELEFNGIIINDRETIENTLNTYSADDLFREELIKEIKKYIAETTIGLIGIPTYICPACKGGQESLSTENKALRNIVPIDSLNLFFTLNILLLDQVSQREL